MHDLHLKPVSHSIAVSIQESIAVSQLTEGFQARSKDQEILEEGGGAGPSHLPRRDLSREVELG